MTGDEEALGCLGLAGRMLLTTDGTITPLLEQVVGEPIVTRGLYWGAAPGQHADVRVRRTMLVGKVTGSRYIDAESVIDLDALPAALREGLLTTDEPIGVLIRRHRVESFRQILSCLVHTPAPATGSGVPARASRRYRIFMGGSPAIVIQEWFADRCFPTAVGIEPGIPHLGGGR